METYLPCVVGSDHVQLYLKAPRSQEQAVSPPLTGLSPFHSPNHPKSRRYRVYRSTINIYSTDLGLQWYSLQVRNVQDVRRCWIAPTIQGT